MDRRDFFKTCFDKTSKAVVKAIDEHASQRATHWIRPPYALAELDFLLACTRCNACNEACPHQVVFPLPARLGIQVVGTPALVDRIQACIRVTILMAEHDNIP